MLEVALTCPFTDRLGEIDVAVEATVADEAAIRSVVGRHAAVGEVLGGVVKRPKWNRFHFGLAAVRF